MKLDRAFERQPLNAVMTVNRKELLALERDSSFVKIRGLWYTLTSKSLGGDKYEVRLVRKEPKDV